MDPAIITEAMLRVSRAYMPERIVYMAGAGSGVALLMYLVLTRLGTFDLATATAVFGSGGLFASTGYGALRAFDKTMDTILRLQGAIASVPVNPPTPAPALNPLGEG